MMVDWLGMESRLREIVRDVVVHGQDPKEGILRIDECIAAYTRRGHSVMPESALEFLGPGDPERYRKLSEKEWDHVDGV